MSKQTQLASMYLGKPHTIERDGDGATGYSNMIFIVDPQSHEILDYITLDNVIDDNHKLNLETYLQTYDAIVLGGGRYDKYLEKRNRVIIPDEDGTLQEFVLFEVDKYRDTEGRKTHFYAHASYLELKKANIIYPGKHESLTASQLGGIALNETGWQIGIVEASGTRTMTIENHTSPYEFIKRIAREFEVELRFRVETDGQRITGRYVDMLERIGEWRGRQVEFGRDLDGIRRIEKQDIVTALLGIGPEQEDGTRLEVLVEDEDALQRWGRVDEHGNLHHLIEVYEIQSDRQEMTETEARQYTRTALDKRINTQVGYETTVVDLEEVPGMSNKKIRFGDTIRIKDTHFNPPLYLEARVYEMTRSLKHKAKKDIKLGDYIEYTEEEVSAVFNQLRNEIRQKVSMAQVREYAEPKIIESPTPPPIEQGENAKWIDTSGEIKVPHVVVGNEWVKMSPTEHDISDADRLSSGIIDVGQVPLRTSVSGARIEWDGVNGLVQYDADNNVVTHLKLDGDATFSGHLEGASGTFSGDLASNAVTVGPDEPHLDDSVYGSTAILLKNPISSNQFGSPVGIGALMNEMLMTVPFGGRVGIYNEDGDPAMIRASVFVDEDLNPAVHIVEQGSNSNGEYIRYDNGIQICWQYISERSVSTSSANIQGLTFYRQSSGFRWDFPATFIETPSTQFTGGLTSNSFAPLFYRKYNVSNTGVNFQPTSIVNFDTVYSLSYYAIGWWK